MALHRIFVHGVGVWAENAGGSSITSPGPLTTVDGIPWTDVLGLPQGFGKKYRGKTNSNVWFQGAVPTPALLASQTVVADDLFLSMLIGSGARLTRIHLWDGRINVMRVDGLSITGDLGPNFETGRNRFDIRRADQSFHRVTFGLAVSMHFTFDQETDVRFDAVGVSFQSPA